jgi:fructosamine-3-kinase
LPEWTAIFDALRAAGVKPDAACEPRPVAGGDISAAWRIDTGDTPVFLKTGPATSWDMFSAEAEGLAELATADAVRVPALLAAGQHADTAYIALEWLDLGRSSGAADRRLGEQLAAMHRVTRDQHGWHRDNTIGLTPQRNDWADDWVDFFRDRRLGFQLRLAARNGYAGRLQESGARLAKRLPFFFTGYRPAASLLHGDLWAGNWAVSDGEPVIFDPAVYFGDRETDLAMTKLFGGFGREFYEAYASSWPLDPGHEARCDLYQLYHVLNHLNLFGSAYLGRAEQLMQRLLRE